ncbi:trehalase family glycosidase [Shimia sp.]|uniref:MGH1-like glycoside hydrolase domain-containing protein n=1 Tax=Shimia sp. TaxID=1954381 RepID=UPI00329A2F56
MHRWFREPRVRLRFLTRYPPVVSFAVRRIFERAADKTLATEQAKALPPKIHAWHQWFHRCRDPQGTGLIALLQPWESGRDNSVDWDAAFERVPTDGVMPFTRRDTQHANPEHRPTQAQYERYIWLVQHFRSLGWDNTKRHNASPFQVVDPGFNAILIRSCSDLAVLADQLNEPGIAAQSRAFAERGLSAMETLWNDDWGQYVCLDRTIDAQIDSPSIGGLLAAFANVPSHRAKAIAKRIGKLDDDAKFLVPSHDPKAPEFDSLRYWRGPIGLIVNYLIADGLAQSDEGEIVRRIVDDSVRLIEESGFAEYYDPITAEPCGGGKFTWTAAMVIEFLSEKVPT